MGNQLDAIINYYFISFQEIKKFSFAENQKNIKKLTILSQHYGPLNLWFRSIPLFAKVLPAFYAKESFPTYEIHS